MDRLNAVTRERARREAKEQAELLLNALGEGTDADSHFLVVHAAQLLECCRELANPSLPLN